MCQSQLHGNYPVLAVNEEVHIYGGSLFVVDNEFQVTEINESIVASVQGGSIQKYDYDGYGNSGYSGVGHRYNGEVKRKKIIVQNSKTYYVDLEKAREDYLITLT